MQNENHVKIVPPPPFLLLINDILANIQLVISPIIYVLFVWIVYYKSPPAMGAYKWYTIQNATNLMISELFYAFAHPEPLFPYPVLIAGGLAKFVTVSQIVANFYADLAIFFIMRSFYNTMVLFAFRYLQTTDSDWIRYLTNPKFVLALNSGSIIFPTCVVIVPLHLQWMTREELLPLAGNISSIDPALRQRLFTSLLISVKRGQLLLLAGYSAAIMSSFVGIVVVGSILGIYRFLRQNRKLLSKRTYALYKTLINVLVIDMVLCGILVFVPLIASMAAFEYEYLFELEISSTITLLTLTAASWYPLCTHIVMLYYVTPYQRAMLGICKNVFQRKRQPDQRFEVFHVRTSILSLGNSSVAASEVGRYV